MFYNEGGETLNRLPREVLGVPLLEMFNVRSDGALSNLV